MVAFRHMRQTKYIVKITKNRKFQDPRGKGSGARVWPYISCSENALFILKSSFLLQGIDQTK